MKVNKQFCHQIFGIAMGTLLAPVLANICLAILEKEIKKNCQNESHPTTGWPELFRRYIDNAGTSVLFLIGRLIILLIN